MLQKQHQLIHPLLVVAVAEEVDLLATKQVWKLETSKLQSCSLDGQHSATEPLAVLSTVISQLKARVQMASATSQVARKVLLAHDELVAAVQPNVGVVIDM